MTTTSYNNGSVGENFDYSIFCISSIQQFRPTDSPEIQAIPDWIQCQKVNTEILRISIPDTMNYEFRLKSSPKAWIWNRMLESVLYFWNFEKRDRSYWAISFTKVYDYCYYLFYLWLFAIILSPVQVSISVQQKFTGFKTFSLIRLLCF